MTEKVSNIPLRRANFDFDPFLQFVRWLGEAEDIEGNNAVAMTLATADRAGRPSVRVVLLRGYDVRGFVFFTDYDSRKARDLAENPRAALTFHWPCLARQVRIEGRVETVPADESDAYFAARPRSHQLEAHASPQSSVISGRGALEEAFRLADEQYAGQEVPRPGNWGGFRLVPETLEFWQQGEHRLHDRLRYRRDGKAWLLERLAP